VRQDIVKAEPTMFLDGAHVLGDGIALGLVGLGHEITDKDFAGIAGTDHLVDLVHQQGRDQVSVDGPGANDDGVRVL